MNIIPDSDGFYHVEQAEIYVAEIARLDYIDNDMKSGSETFNDELNVLSYNCPFYQKLYDNKDDVMTHIKDCMEAMEPSESCK